MAGADRADAPDRAALARVFDRAREAGDVDAMADAAIALAVNRPFGTPIGRAAAYLHEAYTRADGRQRARLAIELARAWAYGAEPHRAAPFAEAAVAAAGPLGDPALLAAALDAELLVHWGPDDLDARLAITARLEDVAAHVLDVETRLSSHLWRLTTALESLDPIGVQRQLHSLAELAQESGTPRVQLFAASRQAMYALMSGDLTAADALLQQVQDAGTRAGEVDTEALVHEITAGIARQRNDLAGLAAEAAAYEAFGTAHGVRAVLAEGAVLWLAAGRPDRARTLLDQGVAGGLAALPRDVDWLMTVCLLTEVAAGTAALDVAALDVAAQAVEVLSPFAGRGVVNAGGVMFLGVVDDYLHRACAALGRTDEAARWAGRAVVAYQGLGAVGWLNRVQPAPAAGAAGAPKAVALPVAAAVGPPTMVLAPTADGVWSIGPAGATVAVREAKGLRYLRLLLERPGVQLTALELVSTIAGNPNPLPGNGFGEVIDRQALLAYRRRITELDDELTQAREWVDGERVARLTAERSMLLDEISAATGLGGRRRVTGADAERARVAVQKALAAALKRIGDVDPALARLLRDTVHTGTRCSYEPDPARPVHWQLRRPAE